jgi:hypothetical protein
MREGMATGSFRGRAGPYLKMRWARIRRTPLAAEVIAVAAGLGIAAGLWIGLGPGRTAPATSYHVSEVTTETFAPQYARQPIVTMREEGAFDPVSHVGEETLPLHPELPAVREIRYIGKYVYEYLTDPGQGGTDGKSWDQVLAPPPSFPSKNNENSVIQNGLANVPNDVLTTVVQPSFRGLESITDDVTFSDFGAPVPVTVPPANQVDNQATGGSFFGPVSLYVQVNPGAT